MLIRGFTRKLDQFQSIIDKYLVNIIISFSEDGENVFYILMKFIQPKLPVIHKQ